MIVAALISFVVYVTLLVLVGLWGLRSARATLISAAFILVVLTVMRQIIFFLGLDVPNPQSHFGESAWGLVTKANIISIIWVVGLVLSYMAFGPASALFRPLFPRSPEVAPGAQVNGLRLVVWVPALFAIGGTLYLVMQAGGFGQFVYSQKIGKALKGLFIFKEATTLASILAIYGFIVSLGERTGKRARLNWRARGFLMIVLLSVSANYAWGNRYNIALTFIVFGLVWHYYVRRLNLIKTAVWSFGLIAVLWWLRDLRGHLVAANTMREFQGLDNPWLSLSAAMHFVEFDAFMLALRDSGDLFDFRQGKDFVNGLLSWVPRFIYTEKETFNIGPWFRQVYQPNKINGWPVTTMGAWYINFGYFGIVLGAVISGAVMRTMDEAFSRLREDPWHAALGIGLAFFMIEGGVNTGFPQKVILYLVPLWLASFWLRMKNARGRIQSRSRRTYSCPDVP